jgi:tRNA uridine 5-carboxymethylaminomethyl modification enzyme
MIDDLVTNGVNEPYRMFTSRSEYRLSIRSDNADIRLSQKAIDYSFMADNRKNEFNTKLSDLASAKKFLLENCVTTSQLDKLGFKVSQDGSRKTAYDLLGLPTFSAADVIKIFPNIENMDKDILELLIIESKYHKYLGKQNEDIEMFKREMMEKIPTTLNYDSIDTLSIEIKEKLKKTKPSTIASARAISGMTPAALLSLIIHIKTKNFDAINSENIF